MLRDWALTVDRVALFAGLLEQMQTIAMNVDSSWHKASVRQGDLCQVLDQARHTTATKFKAGGGSPSAGLLFFPLSAGSMRLRLL